MELIQIFFTSLGSVIVLFLLTKLIGNRQMSQLSMFDYINGITIGSIAAEMATSLEDDFLKPLVAMIVYAVLTVGFSYASIKSIRLRRLLTGRSLILYQNGKIYACNLKKAKLDVGEFLIQCRNNGFFNIADLSVAVLEANGKISFLPVSDRRPATPADLGLTPADEKLLVNVVIDGKVMQDNLRFTGNNQEWLEKQLRAQGFPKVSEVFLATCDADNRLSVYQKIEKPMTRDPFQ